MANEQSTSDTLAQ